ncbi:uncharacterized protein LOC132310392 [Cornus florida]|uniref:uncharacterized protein LOC132310392 n=1 Tax=Cornus florida TaxID=4283 RepID=UPI0028978C69|nr:uncharacterized protein LOC132310392 [Cornus florida]
MELTGSNSFEKTVGVVPPMLQIEKSSSSTTNPSTSLSLSLPGSDSCEVSNQVFRSHQVMQPTQLAPPPPSPPVIVHQFAPPPMVAHSGQNFEFGAPTAEKQFFSQEFLSVMQEMVRKEVKNYMSEIEQNGLRLHAEAIMSVNY